MTETETAPELSRWEMIARTAAEAAAQAVLQQLPDYAALQEQLQKLRAELDLRPLPADLAGLSAQQTELAQQLETARAEILQMGRLLANFAQQLNTLQDKHDTERQARIAADADTLTRLRADLKLAQLERQH